MEYRSGRMSREYAPTGWTGKSGREVEAAIALRKVEAQVAIVHESDFWDAAAEQGELPPALA